MKMRLMGVLVLLGCLSVASECFLIDWFCSREKTCNDNGDVSFEDHHCRCNCDDEWQGESCDEEKNQHAHGQHRHTTTTTRPTTTITTTTTTTTKRTTTTTLPTTTVKLTTTPLSTKPPSKVAPAISYPRCYVIQTLSTLSNGVTVTNVNASSCVGEDHTGSDALVMTHCNVDIPMFWKPGVKVMDNCDILPQYVPISTFENGHFNAKTTEAAIFLGCIPNGMRVGIQTCDRGLLITNCTIGGIGYYNADMYYVIVDPTRHP